MSGKPTGVLILAIIELIFALSWIAVGALLLMAGTGTLLDILLMFMAFFPLLIGVIGLILFYGIWTTKGWAWMWTLIIGLLGIVAGLTASNIFDLMNLLGLGLSVILVIYLLMPGVRSHFT
ncbi:MAG: hypothetical protein ACFFD9_06770 [Candidatus Thorarchaeota archaeon]